MLFFSSHYVVKTVYYQNASSVHFSFKKRPLLDHSRKVLVKRPIADDSTKILTIIQSARGDMVDEVCVNTNMSSIYKKYNS